MARPTNDSHGRLGQTGGSVAVVIPAGSIRAAAMNKAAVAVPHNAVLMSGAREVFGR
jgi:hypothetical protein